MAPDVPPIRVLVVDDREVARRGVASVLQADLGIRVVAEAGSVGEALVRSRAVRPHVAVVAMRLPDGSGALVCERLRARVPGARALVLGRCSEAGTVRRAVQAGASGYLSEAVRGTDLVEAVRRVARGATAFDRTARAALACPRDARPDPLAVLTPRERAVLHLIGLGLPNREIARRLRLAEKTVKNHTSRLLGKLHLDNRTQAAILATRMREDRRRGEGEREAAGACV